MAGYTHRNDSTVRENQIVGGIPVYATQYTTGRTDVQIHNGAPANAEQAAALFGE